MFFTVFSVFCGLFAVGAFLSTIWAWLSIREINHQLKFIDYLLNLSFYNDFVIQLRGSSEISKESEFQLALLQDQLTKQAQSIGVEFKPFQRPTGN